MGFTADLRCSTCAALQGFLGDESEVVASCRACCAEDDAVKFASAVIDVRR